MGFIRSLFVRPRPKRDAPAVRAVPLPTVTKPGGTLMPIRSDRDVQDRLRALRATSPHDWVFVLATGDIAERAGGAVVPVTDLERRLLGYVPVSAVAGAARALVQARAVLCPARFETTAESGELSLALDGEFLMRRLDDRLATIDLATSR